MRRKHRIALAVGVGIVIVAAAIPRGGPDVDFPSFPMLKGQAVQETDDDQGSSFRWDYTSWTFQVSQPWATTYPLIKRDLLAQGFEVMREVKSGTLFFRTRDRRTVNVMKKGSGSQMTLDVVRVGRQATVGESIRSRLNKVLGRR